MPYVANFIDDTQSKINNVREALPHPRGDVGLHPNVQEGPGRTPSSGRFPHASDLATRSGAPLETVGVERDHFSVKGPQDINITD
ncbi:hypothetical protein ACFW9N_45155 [Streptomyces sp. NPDC059496]|uniref:hypothetical protein n=1 Tax=Streptomyces sp. NPDC059496 TaxID=3346851 RepID=UPI0036A27E91